jgi:hypothetical protein
MPMAFVPMTEPSSEALPLRLTGPFALVLLCCAVQGQGLLSGSTKDLAST